MPKKQPTASRKARTDARAGAKFTTSRREHEKARLRPAELAALGVADAERYASSFAADDHGWDANSARNKLWDVQQWEERRAGRPVRLWSAVIEVRAAALDADDAWKRLSLYMRHPVHRVEADLSATWEIDTPESSEDHHREIAPLDAARLSEKEIRRMEADYPRTVFGYLDTREVLYGPWEQAHVADYVAALGRACDLIRAGRGTTAADRRAWAVETGAPRGPLPDGVELTFWRGHRRVEFLAGCTEASARARAAELAASIVDYAGLPTGRVVKLEPDDGFRSAKDGRWIHPAAFTSGGQSCQALFDDYDHVEQRRTRGEDVGSRPVLLNLYQRERQRLRDHFAASTSRHAAHEAKLHTQSDGTRTYASPGMIRMVTANARSEAQGKSPTDLRAMADHADYLANRVYGKVVEADNDVHRIEAAAHRAKVWRTIAEQIETLTTLAGPASAEWPLLGITCRTTHTPTGPALEVLAETADGEHDLVGLWLLDTTGQPTGPYQVVLRLRPDGSAHTVPSPGEAAPPHPAETAVVERARWLGITSTR